MSNFTKGEWKAVDNEVYFDILAGDVCIGNTCSSLHTQDGSKHIKNGIAAANAKLMAAAPDMYNLLEQVRDDSHNKDDILIIEINELLAKARGES